MARRKAPFPWLTNRKKTAAEVPLETPIPLGNKSNGEFFHEQTPYERKLRDFILRESGDQARRLGMERREFLASSAGMAASLWALNLASGCGGSAKDGGGYNVPPPETLDCEAASELLSGNEFIFDLQTHHIEDEDSWRERHPGNAFYPGEIFANALTFWECSLEPRSECIGPDQYVEQIYLNSDTTVGVLSGIPSPICEEDGTLCTNLNSNDAMAHWRDYVNNASGGTQRVVQHCQVAPNDNWELQKENMTRIRERYGNHGWKCYPPWGVGSGADRGWWLDDPAIADPFIEHTKTLGNPLLCVHKGFPLAGFERKYADPRDVGPAASKHPDVTFIIYHSGYENGHWEGPYDPDGGGVNRLIRTVLDHDLAGKNVYAEMGSAWYLASLNTVSAQHYVGKVLKYLGEDHLLWGSECLWFGSPQPQIEEFRNLEISEEFQETYGYPALTKEIKEKILGRSAARLYGVDPDEARCTVDQGLLRTARADLDGELGGRRWAMQPLPGPRTRREFIQLTKWREFLKVPA